MRVRSVVSLVLVALIAGAVAAHADSAGSGRRVRTPARVVAAPAPARPFAGAAPLAIACAAPVPVDPRRPAPQPPKAATAAPPSQQLLDAFAILRRPRTDQDALSPAALEALRVRGLSPVSLDSSRLLRSTASGGKAWVVPVPNVVGRLGVACEPVGQSGPREGLVVVAVGDAASGGGGALDDLVRGRAPVTLAPCAGADHSMLSISGIVPNGVPAVFLTAPDGTAVRADVKDNAYEFLLPNQRASEQRYVVWTGGDGTPHVQPIVTFAAVRTRACTAAAKLLGDGRAGVSGRVRPVRRAADRQQVRDTAEGPTVARPAPAPPGRGHALRRPLHGARPVRAGRAGARTAGPCAAGRDRARPPRARAGATAVSRAVSAPPGARPLPRPRPAASTADARRPRVASVRWLLPDPSSS